jgi:hypothetical protein
VSSGHRACCRNASEGPMEKKRKMGAIAQQANSQVKSTSPVNKPTATRGKPRNLE